ncbi:flagellin N-terminal helical domain-containing protein [Novipirellula aureliae]|nr:flagellin hook IN motif-containing protein [Novipirellula aureliae]
MPVSTTRTNSALSTQRLLQQLNADQLALQRQYDQLSTGRRVLRLSDDPAAANRAVALNRGIDRGEQLVRNANSVTGSYDSADSALGKISTALIQARGAAVEGAQTVLSDDERVAISTTISETIQNLFAAGNSMFRDQQLLGGILDSGNALVYDGNEVVYTGRNAIGRTEIGAGTPAAINVTASESLGAFSMILEGDPLNAALDRETRLGDMKEGRGVSAGIIRISGGGEYTTVDLRTAGTIGDVADVLSSLEIDGRKLNVRIGDDTFEVAYADGLAGTLAIEDASGGSMAKDLSIENKGGAEAPPIIGDKLMPRVTTNTKIASLNFGADEDISDGLIIRQGNQSFNVDLSEAETMGDVLIAINRSGADVHASLNETEGRIELHSLRSGVDYSIGENGGNAATVLGIRSATGQTLIEELGHDRGVILNNDTPDLSITRPDGRVLELDLESAKTVDDVIELIQNHPQNQDSARVLVGLNEFGNGIELNAPPGTEPMVIRQLGTSNAGNRLGLIPEGQNEASGESVGSVNQIAGTDYMPLEAGGAIDTLLRLEKAVLDGDVGEIDRLQQRIDDDLDRATYARAKVGIWSRNMLDMKETTETQIVQMKEQLSNEVDADLATVISEMQQRQVAMEASMQLIAKTSQMTILNYL